jgi:hypothetical protein
MINLASINGKINSATFATQDQIRKINKGDQPSARRNVL